MEDSHKQHVHDQDDHDSGSWAVVTAGNSRIIGRVRSLLLPNPDPYNEPGERFKRVKVDNEVAVDKVLAAFAVEFCPTYDFFSPLQRVPVPGPDGRPMLEPNGMPKVALAREPVVTGRDFALHAFPVELMLGPGTFFDFFCKMHEEDKKTYTAFIKSAREANKREQDRQNGGPKVHIPTAGEIVAASRGHRRG
jgi:hypothetical protein